MEVPDNRDNLYLIFGGFDLKNYRSNCSKRDKIVLALEFMISSLKKSIKHNLCDNHLVHCSKSTTP